MYRPAVPIFIENILSYGAFYLIGSIIKSSPLHSDTDNYDSSAVGDQINWFNFIYFPNIHHVDDTHESFTR